MSKNKHEKNAENAKSQMNGRLISSKPLQVSYFQEKEEKTNKHINEENKTLFVGNLDEKINSYELEKLFEKFGTITFCRVMEKNGKSKGYGIVEFFSEEEAKSSISFMNGRSFYSKQLKVDFHRPKVEQKNDSIKKNLYSSQLSLESQSLSNSKKIYVKNLHEDAGDSDLKNLFERFGSITSCYVMKEKNGRSKQSGVITFSNEEEALNAIRIMDGSKYMSKDLCVKFWKSKKESKKDSIPDSRIKNSFGSQSSLESQSLINSKKVYVKNLHEDARDSDLNNLFAQFRPIKCYVMKGKNGKSKRSGVVEFSYEEDASNAIRYVNGSMYMSRELSVEFWKPKSENKDSIPDSRNKPSSSQKLGSSFNLSIRSAQSAVQTSSKKLKHFKLRIENLEDNVDNDGLRRLFSPFGKIILAKVITNNTGTSKGYGFVSYESNEEARKAISSMNGVPLSSKKNLVVTYSKKKEKSSNVDGNKNEVEKECCVCYGDLTSRIVFDPCGHTCVCDDCVTQLNNECPICRVKFIKFMKVYI